MDLTNDNRAEAWIPHRGAMRLLDRVVHVDHELAVAEVDVPADGLFVHDGQVPSWIGIEYMAQTVSAWAGGRTRDAGGRPRVGLLLGSRKYTAHRAAFPAGATLRVEARCELMGNNGLGLFACRIDLDGTEVAQAKLSVYEPRDAAAMFNAAEAP